MKLRDKIALTLMYLWAASAVGWVSLSVVVAFFAPHLLLDNLFAGLFLVVGVGVVVAIVVTILLLDTPAPYELRKPHAWDRPPPNPYRQKL